MTTRGTPRDLLGVDVPEAQAEACLERAEYGVLGLSRDGEAYTVPVSFGYDRDLTRLYFLFAFDEGSQKRAFIETTDTATFTVVDSDLPDAWTSVIFRGELGALSDTQTTAYSALGDTATFPAMHTFEDYVTGETVEQALYQFDVESVTARGSPGREDATAGE
jgi:nitroimidazol reductase NimA-like FMN-containing flavoprotein (pyridoxamine 5'-phosphate oxidase superfamily)